MKCSNTRIIEVPEEKDRKIEKMNQRGKKKNELKETRISSDTSGTMLNAPTFES